MINGRRKQKEKAKEGEKKKRIKERKNLISEREKEGRKERQQEFSKMDNLEAHQAVIGYEAHLLPFGP